MEIGLLVLRLVVGFAFAVHGAQKLFGAFGGHGIAGTASNFEQLGLRPGRRHAWLAGVAEVSGALLLALGLFTPFAVAGLIAVMTVAILHVHGRNGFLNANGGFEYNLVMIAAGFALAGVGPGDWSLDNALGFDLHGTVWALAALGAGVLGGLGATLSGRLFSRGEPAPGQPHAA
jgi:putative oxidoreductase